MAQLFRVRIDITNDNILARIQTYASVEKKVDQAMRSGVRSFLQSILAPAPEGLPTITGATKRSFERLAAKYQVGHLARLLTPKHDYYIWKGWDQPEWPQATDDLQTQWWGGFVTWQLIIPAMPFQMNEFGPRSYKKFWQKTESGDSPPWPDRRPQRSEPWNLLNQGKGIMIPQMKRRVAAAIKSTALKALKAAGYRTTLPPINFEGWAFNG